MAQIFLQLNKDKTEVLVIGPRGQRELQYFKPSQLVKNLGVCRFSLRPAQKCWGMLLYFAD